MTLFRDAFARYDRILPVPTLNTLVGAGRMYLSQLTRDAIWTTLVTDGFWGATFTFGLSIVAVLSRGTHITFSLTFFGSITSRKTGLTQIRVWIRCIIPFGAFGALGNTFTGADNTLRFVIAVLPRIAS